MQQLPETILIDGVLHSLYTAPLLCWIRDQDGPLVFDRRAASCVRGYVGCWQIRDGIVGLAAQRGAGCRRQIRMVRQFRRLPPPQGQRITSSVTGRNRRLGQTAHLIFGFSHTPGRHSLAHAGA